ncbi:MAG: VIT1/CCC1 transporter family protein [Planctomycetota bacterium]
MNRHELPGKSELAAQHTAEAIRKRLEAGFEADYLPDFVYGAIDGTVTTFAVVSGVAGANLSPSIVIILGLANLIGDGFSMAASNFSGTRVERQSIERARAREYHEIKTHPAGEREEIRQIMQQKGFDGDELARAVEIITSDKDRWVRVMMTDEMGLTPITKSPLRAAATTFVAFLLLGFLPLAPFVLSAFTRFDHQADYSVSVLVTALAFFLIGGFKSRFVNQRWWTAGLETLSLGGAAAALAYAVGALLSQLVL